MLKSSIITEDHYYIINKENIQIDLFDYVSSAIYIARKAGEELQNKFNSPDSINVTKHSRNIQTSCDLSSNTIITNELLVRYPSHNIKSEEDRTHSPFSWKYKSNYIWIVDPCDGTVNYYRGIPFYSVSIALAIDNEIVLGVVFDPVRDEMFWAVKGMGARLNNKRINVSSITSFKQATLGVDIYHSKNAINNEIELIRKLSSRVLITRSLYSGALELCYLAAGRLDIRIDDSYRPWDVAAGHLIAKEAGATVTNLFGVDWSIKSKSLLAATPKLHKKILNIIMAT
jgi:myo-inositol-1(or 4)-monophosphatase